MKKSGIITRTVWILSLVSMFTDLASELLYPVMPVYLKSIGFSVLLIGVLEGVAEATAGLSKGYFGKLSDVSGRRVPFVQLGYGMSALSKPLMALMTAPLWIFLARTMDRFGKGIRTGARDAILSEEATPPSKGRIFGFHRSMDTLGAVIGPVLALVYLYYNPGDYRTLFLLALVPGLLAIIASFSLKEKSGSEVSRKHSPGIFSFIKYWKQSPDSYRRLTLGLLIFALFNSSDMFLLLKAGQSGLSDTEVIAVYIFYNLVFALSAYPLGVIGDRIGLKKMFMLGIALFAVVYISIGFQTNLYAIGGLFLLYGVYIAATDGVSKAWISNISKKEDTATAIGTYAGFQSIAAMLSSSITGLLWFSFGPKTAFVVAGVGAMLVFIYFVMFVPSASRN